MAEAIANGFPPLPAFQATWAPIYFEPLQDSGERVVVAVACTDLAGNAGARLTVSERAIKCLFGKGYEPIMGVVSIIYESIAAHMEIGAPLDTWRPPTVNCKLGPIRIGYSESVSAMLDDAARLTASLARTEGERVESSGDFDLAFPLDNFVRQVRASINLSTPTLAGYFNKSVRIRADAEPTDIGYLGAYVAANFDVIAPGKAPLDRRRRAKSKLFDLQQLKDHVDLMGRRNSYELLVWWPTKPRIFSKKDIRGAEAAFAVLEEYGNTHELEVKKMADPEEAAERIIKLERAA